MTDAIDKSILPTETRQWLSNDGQLYGSFQDAAAANLATMLSGDNADGRGVTPALAKIIVDRRDDVITLLRAIDAHTDKPSPKQRLDAIHGGDPENAARVMQRAMS
jgi:hypothetical protein